MPTERSRPTGGIPSLNEIHKPRGAQASPSSPGFQRLKGSVSKASPSLAEEPEAAPLRSATSRRKAQVLARRLPRPAEPRVFAVANQKGGVGKTTTAVNIAAALAEGGLKVLVIDMDPQGNASTALGVDHDEDVNSIYDVLLEDLPLQDAVAPAPVLDGLWCVPATIHVAGAEIELVPLENRDRRLKEALDAYGRHLAAEGLPPLDYVIIDCPPSLGLLTVNAFVAATEVMIPIQCEYYALEGLSQLLNNISLIRHHLNPQLAVSTILLTMFDRRTRLSSQVAEDVRSHFPEVVLETVIPRSVRISEAPSFQQTVISYDSSSSGALSYREAAAEIAERGRPEVRRIHE